jgi:type I restriction enzyme S subunit
LSIKRIPEVKVPLPSIGEQRRIVGRIEELAAETSEASNLRHQASIEANALWERGASEVYDRAAKTCAARPLSELVTIRGGGTPSKSNPFYWEGKIPWITPKDMKSRELSDAIDHISELATQESPAKLVEPGAVLVVVRGMILAHTFPSAVLRRPATINQDMKALIPKEELLPEFLCAFFWASNARMLKLVEKSTHDTRKLETTKLLGTSILVPPIDQQRRIVAELNELQAEVNSLKRLQAETAAELDALLPAILDRAFKGQI